ncbi:hypothetical protein SAMN04488542_10781 [Fontibacillus panacisegetis]|uniref:Uncharacterized protein n=1 Tax=Fontibacillus panacisegetis TaxID=670482 RepID=A0A1G7JAD4_9BACL|nr:hypothetical protein SAMN04488542_10781 [Fontibacillus panacisegetis]
MTKNNIFKNMVLTNKMTNVMLNSGNRFLIMKIVDSEVRSTSSNMIIINLLISLLSNIFEGGELIKCKRLHLCKLAPNEHIVLKM